MRLSLQLLVLGVVLALGVVNAPRAPAADKEQVIKERQELMKNQSSALGAVKGYLDDKNDQAKATTAATDLTQTMRKIPDVFPQGTEGPSPDGKYATKPEVWKDWNEFTAIRDTAANKADALLAAVKSGDKGNIQTAFADLGKNGCGACHGKFREEIKK